MKTWQKKRMPGQELYCLKSSLLYCSTQTCPHSGVRSTKVGSTKYIRESYHSWGKAMPMLPTASTSWSMAVRRAYTFQNINPRNATEMITCHSFQIPLCWNTLHTTSRSTDHNCRDLGQFCGQCSVQKCPVHKLSTFMAERNYPFPL